MLMIKCCVFVVYLYIPTSNHNLPFVVVAAVVVVYLYIPTSNHNLLFAQYKQSVLYIFIFLHQTTTLRFTLNLTSGCISLYSYIKPQLFQYLPINLCGCISLYSYIKPQHNSSISKDVFVVYLYIPTSNHN